MQTKQLTIRVEVWLAAAMLHEAGHATFTPGRLVEEVERRFGDTRPGVMTHVSAHCVASARKNSSVVYSYLTRTEDGLYRLFRSGDPVHPSRSGIATYPEQADLPEAYWDLWRRWAPGAK